MPEIWGIILTALLSALVGAIGGSWALNRSAAKKSEVEALSGIIETYRKERESDRKEIDELHRLLNAKDKRIDDLEQEIGELREYMEKRGLKPPPRERKQAEQ